MDEKQTLVNVYKPRDGSALFKVTCTLSDGSKYVVSCVINKENISDLCKLLPSDCNENLIDLQEAYSNYLTNCDHSNAYKTFISKLREMLGSLNVDSMVKIGAYKTQVERYLIIQMDDNTPDNFNFVVVRNTPTCILTNEKYDAILFENNHNYNDTVVVSCKGDAYRVCLQDDKQLYKSKDEQLQFLSKIHSAYNDYYKDKQGYQVTGSVPKTPLISAIMSKQNFNYRCKVIPTAIKGKFSKQTVNNMTTTNGLSLIPIGAKNHATLLIVEKTNDNTTTYLYSLIDTSLQHVMLSNKKQVVRGIFSGFNDEEIDVLLDSPLQINGCCSYWADSFMEAIIMNPEKYTDMKSIKNAMDDGSLILEACCIMSKIFDEHGKETVKKFDANEEENDDYFMFEIAGGEKYGINKNCWSNKFVNIESLINLSLKTKTSTRDNLMEQLKVQIEKQKIIRPIEVAINSVQKIQKKGSDGFDVFNVLLQKFDDIEKYDKTLYKDLLSNLRTHGRMLSGCLETNNKELPKESTQFDFLIDLINQKSVLDNNSTCVRGLIELYGQNGIMEKYLNDLKQYLMKNEGLEQLESNDNYKNIREQQKKEKDGKCLSPNGITQIIKIVDDYVKCVGRMTEEQLKKEFGDDNINEKKQKIINILSSKSDGRCGAENGMESPFILDTIIPQPSLLPETEEEVDTTKQQLDNKSKQLDLHSETVEIL